MARPPVLQTRIAPPIAPRIAGGVQGLELGAVPDLEAGSPIVSAHTRDGKVTGRTTN
ncbi:hypothetical protein [Streptomyces luteolifulvus]|jgi:hypothetical protein|uniref:hypothetical protein n=1 Tax=Streptomyces luteolifulvus TaxID=2615112 RepID=UPI00177D0E50|nr:hypothetical protein [Streptomyces luteolifulvus]